MGYTRGKTSRGGGRGSGRGGGRGGSRGGGCAGRGRNSEDLNLDDSVEEALSTSPTDGQEQCTAHGTLHSDEQQLEKRGPRGEDRMTKTAQRQQALPPPLATRPTNRNTHPGAIVAPPTRRSSEAVQAERLRLQEIQAEADMRQSAAVTRIAELEDQMALRDTERSMHAHRPRTPTDLPPRRAHTRALAAITERSNELSDSQHEQNQGEVFNSHSLV